MQDVVKQEIPTQTQFRLDNILVKNLSLEMPENIVTPVYGSEPTVQLELRNTSRALSRDNFSEVVLEATVRIRNGEDLQLLIEMSQAGIFYIEETDTEKRQILLNVHAPEILYPYLTHLIVDLMIKAGAPRIFLPPFDFRAVYEKRRELLQKKLAEEKITDSTPT